LKITIPSIDATTGSIVAIIEALLDPILKKSPKKAF